MCLTEIRFNSYTCTLLNWKLMSMLNLFTPYNLVLSSCDEEPIHIPGSIQPHGMLMVLKEPELTIIQISDNSHCFFSAWQLEELIGYPIERVISKEEFISLKKGLVKQSINNNPTFLFKTVQSDINDIKQTLSVVGHRKDGFLILEIEPDNTENEENHIKLIHALKYAFFRIRQSVGIEEFWQTAIEEIKSISGFDRIMVYKFEQEGHGSVIAEIKNESLESYLDLHFPASDIPQQARKLYIKNLLRFIPDINYQLSNMVPLIAPEIGVPLDMSYSGLRSVSPIHLQFLRNMGVSATLTISIIEGDSLKGMIACHHYSPKYVSYEIRVACLILGQFINLEHIVRMQENEYQYQLKLREMEAKFIEFMTHVESFADGLMNFSPNLGDFINAEGAVLYDGSVNHAEDKIRTVGLTPSQYQIHDLITWLSSVVKESVYCTDELPRVFSPALEYKNIASGLLAIRISVKPNMYILWFRPEKIQTVNWVGDPERSNSKLEEGEMLTPRASFEIWKEIVKLKSLPWSPYEQIAAKELREMILRVLLYKEENLAVRNIELERLIMEKTKALAQSNMELEQFAMVASHDLQAPLRKITQLSDILKSNTLNELSEEDVDYIDRIQKTTHKMQKLIDNLLNLSRVNRTSEKLSFIDLREVILVVIRDLDFLIKATNAAIIIEETISIECYSLQMYQLFQNLIENSIKFQQENITPIIKIQARALDSNLCEITVQDNGIGFNEKYLDRIFKVFEKLHGTSAYEGSGIGLAIVQKVVERHKGSITAKSKLGEGATFIIRLPIHQ